MGGWQVGLMKDLVRLRKPDYSVGKEQVCGSESSPGPGGEGGLIQEGHLHSRASVCAVLSSSLPHSKFTHAFLSSKLLQRHLLVEVFLASLK